MKKTQRISTSRMPRSSSLLKGPTLGETLALARDLHQENKQYGKRARPLKTQARTVTVITRGPLKEFKRRVILPV